MILAISESVNHLSKSDRVLPKHQNIEESMCQMFKTRNQRGTGNGVYLAALFNFHIVLKIPC